MLSDSCSQSFNGSAEGGYFIGEAREGATCCCLASLFFDDGSQCLVSVKCRSCCTGFGRDCGEGYWLFVLA